MLEKKGLVPDTKRKPGDVFLPVFSQAQPLAVDCVYASPCAASAYRQAAQSQGFAASTADAAKVAKSADKCLQQRIAFLPLAAEVFGGWTREALAFITRVGSMMANNTGRSPAEEVRYFRQRISLALQRTNAAMVQARQQVV